MNHGAEKPDTLKTKPPEFQTVFGDLQTCSFFLTVRTNWDPWNIPLGRWWENNFIHKY